MLKHIQFSDEEILLMYKVIGNNVKKLREKHGITQMQLSQAMGNKSASLVSAAELASDKKHFNLEQLYKISKILNEPLSDFLK